MTPAAPNVITLSAPPAAQAALPIHAMALKTVVNTPRSQELARLESYYRCTQYAHLRYDWDGNIEGYGGSADIEPGWAVPIKQRKPVAMRSLPRSIVGRFTALLFGRERWPEISIPGDPDAEDYAKALIKASRLPSKILEARNLGGAEGTACLSFGFVRGKPRVRVHNAKNCTVLTWDDPDEFRPLEVLEAYMYKRTIVVDGQPKQVDYYYARYWDDTREIVWDPIPKELGDEIGWSTRVPHREVIHGYGFCPFYWIQNLPDSENTDGESDYAGQLETVDEINRLLSSTSRGTIANVDPTLVVKMDPSQNDGTVRKGAGNAIYSSGGAEYLEISGDAVRAALDLESRLRAGVLESAQCVISDPDKLSAQAPSGESLRIQYQPMTAKADVQREQYGAALCAMIADMLEAARQIEATGAQYDEQGVLRKVTIELEPKIETEIVVGEDGEKTERQTIKKRVPGSSSNITLNWPPYFAATWDDIHKGVTAARTGVGEKPVLSYRTAVKMISTMTGVENVEAEVLKIEEDAEVAAEQAAAAFALTAEMAPGENDDDKEEEEKAA